MFEYIDNAKLLGPGYFEAFYNGKAWVRNCNKVKEIIQQSSTNISTRNIGRNDIRWCWLNLGQSIADVLDVLNKKPADVHEIPSTYNTIKETRKLQGSPRPFLEELDDESLTLMITTSQGVLSGREVLRKEAEENKRREECQRVWTERGKSGLLGFSNFLVGALHALGCKRQLAYSEHKDPSKEVNPLDFTAMKLAQATQDYLNRSIRTKTFDPVDKKVPWLRTAQEHLNFKLRMAKSGGSDVDKRFFTWVDERKKAQAVKPGPNVTGMRW